MALSWVEQSLWHLLVVRVSFSNPQCGCCCDFSLSVSVILDSSSFINLQLDGREMIVPAQDDIKTFTPDFEAGIQRPLREALPSAPGLSHPPNFHH